MDEKFSKYVNRNTVIANNQSDNKIKINTNQVSGYTNPRISQNIVGEFRGGINDRSMQDSSYYNNQPNPPIFQSFIPKNQNSQISEIPNKQDFQQSLDGGRLNASLNPLLKKSISNKPLFQPYTQQFPQQEDPKTFINSKPKNITQKVQVYPNQNQPNDFDYVQDPYSRPTQIRQSRQPSFPIDFTPCDDHLKQKEEVEAKKYCEFCKVFLCDSCVLDNHDSHVKQAKMPIDNLFKMKEEQLRKVFSQISNVSNELNQDRYNKDIDKEKQRIQENSDEIINKINSIKVILDDVIRIEKQSTKLLLDQFDSKVEEELFGKKRELNKVIQDFDQDVKKISFKWNSFTSLAEKAKFIKENDFENIALRFNDINNEVNKETKRSENLVQKLIDCLKDSVRKVDYTNSIETLLVSSSDFKNKVEELKKEPVSLQYQDNNSYLDFASIKSFNLLSENQKSMKENPKITNQMVKDGTHQFFLSNSLEFQYLLNIRGNDTIFLYNFSNKDSPFTSHSIPDNDSCIALQIKSFPDNCRYVNTGSALIVCGGKEDGRSTSKCFEVKVINNQLIVKRFAQMVEAREGHNLIYIPDRDEIVVSCGFGKYSTEFFTNKLAWEFGKRLINSRANATMAYLNKKYLCCFGGFEIQNERQFEGKGKYLASFEILDMDNKNAGWSKFELEKDKELCAMGVIPKSDNKILLVGGYDGKTYRNDVIEFILEGPIEEKKFSINTLKTSKLPLQTIFLHNSFSRNNNFGYAFDIYTNVVRYDGSYGKFDIVRYAD